MRYVSKIHVLDVMDEIVVSGYVFDADPLTDPDHDVLEFALTVPGRGQDDPVVWLAQALYGLVLDLTKPAPEGKERASRMGGQYTISETSDRG